VVIALDVMISFLCILFCKTHFNPLYLLDTEINLSTWLHCSWDLHAPMKYFHGSSLIRPWL